MGDSFLGTVGEHLDDLSLRFPLWSVISCLLVSFVLFTGQSFTAAGWVTSAFFGPVNEFLCSFAWIAWTLEGLVISYTWSPTLGLTFLFLRLVLAPYIFKGAYANPCSVFYRCMWHGLLSTWSIFHFLLYVSIEMAATICAVLYTMAFWNFFGENISRDHKYFLDSKFEYFLQASPMYGAGVEMFVTMLTFTPRIFLGPSLFQATLESLITVGLVIQFESMTGAMMNPIVAFGSALPWHSLDYTGYLTHIAVFWFGPFVGTAIAVLLAKAWAKRQHSE